MYHRFPLKLFTYEYRYTQLRVEIGLISSLVSEIKYLGYDLAGHCEIISYLYDFDRQSFKSRLRDLGIMSVGLCTMTFFHFLSVIFPERHDR